MKKIIILFGFLITMIFYSPATAEIIEELPFKLSTPYSLELAVPFGIAHIEGKESVPLYETTNTKSASKPIPDLQICEVIESETIDDEVWFYVFYFTPEGNLEMGYLIGTDFFQFTMAGLVKIMGDEGIAEYMQRYIVAKDYTFGFFNGSAARSSPVRTLAYVVFPEESILPEESDRDFTFIKNKNTKKFHLPSCSSVNDMKNKNLEKYTGSRDDLINEGYTPCQKCNP